MDRTGIILLGIAAGLVAVAIVFFSTPFVPAKITKDICEDSDGVWNECGSPCAGEPAGTACIEVCIPVCECKSGYQCPPGYYCSLSNETGVCKTPV